MKTSWRRFYRRVAGVCFVGGATAWSSAMCHAVQLAFDSASDAAYADGWDGEVTNITPMMGPGDNGGFGFTPWSFDNGIYEPPVIGIRSMDGPPTAADPTRTQSPFNQVGAAWRIGLKYNETSNPEWKDIVFLGRGLATPLQVGQTVSIVVDPPSEHAYYDIESIRLTTGGSTCPGCDPSAATRFDLGFFNYNDLDNYDRWGANSIGYTTLFTKDKAPFEHPDFPTGAAGSDAGMRLDFTLTGAETFDLTLTPLDAPASVFTGSGTLANPGAGPIDWIEFMHWGRPTPEPDPNAFDTDFFIRSLEVTSDAPAETADFDGDGDVDGADFLTWQRGKGTASGAMLDDGDGDGDGDVDADDLALWKQQFGPGGDLAAAVGGGSDCGCGSLAAVQAAVPEPGAFVYVASALAALAGRAMSRRRS